MTDNPTHRAGQGQGQPGEQGHAGREHGRERACPAGDAGLSYQAPQPRGFDPEGIKVLSYLGPFACVFTKRPTREAGDTDGR